MMKKGSPEGSERQTKIPRGSLLWITDPWDKLNHATDTTLRLAQECVRLGLPAYWCDVKSIHYRSSVLATVRAFTSFKAGTNLLSAPPLGPPFEVPVSTFGTVLYRTDPPVSDSYLQPLRILKLIEKSVTWVNPIDVLTGCSEKLEGLEKPGLYPDTLVSSDREKLAQFGREQIQTVLKPLNQARTRGVELLSWKTPEEIQISLGKVESETRNFTLPIQLQKFLPEIHTEGEVRLWFVDAKLIASAKKTPVAGEFRFRSRDGAKVSPHVLKASEKKVASLIQFILKKRGIRMAAIDMIAGRVTDFNFTSPGLLVEMEAALGQNLAEKIVKSLKRKSPKARR
jgi:glutathione synthase